MKGKVTKMNSELKFVFLNQNYNKSVLKMSHVTDVKKKRKINHGESSKSIYSTFSAFSHKEHFIKG